MQEARFAGACQDQHAGRPAPSLGWPGERKSIGATRRGKRRFSKISSSAIIERKSVQQTKVTRAPRGLGPRAWAWLNLPPFFIVLKSLVVGGRRRGGRRLKRLPRRWGPGGKRARDTPPTPLPREKKRVSPPLLKPSNTPPKVGG